MPDPSVPPQPDPSTPVPVPPQPDISTPRPPSMDPDQDPGEIEQPELPDLGTGKEQRPAGPAADTYIFGNRGHHDLAMSELDELHIAMQVAREFASFVMTRNRTWPETEAELRLIHEECHWHLEHDHGVII